MDRRFDRLQRTKADKVDLIRCATKGQLRRFATKKDLERFATKKDLERFATKKDLERFATKEDFARCASKDDLARCASKDDLARLEATMRIQFDSLNEKIDSVLRIVRDQYSHHGEVLTEHDRRITDLERRSLG
jgi:hypothetical protein